MDEFSDDGFDELNDSILQELEDKAIQFTQAQKLAQTQVSLPARHDAPEYDFEDDDLDNTVVVDQHAQPPPIPRPPPQAVTLQQPRHATGPAGTQRWNQHLPPPRPSYPARSQYPPPRPPAHQPQAAPRYPSAPSRPQPPPQRSQFSRPPPPIPRTPRPLAAQAPQALHRTAPTDQNEIVATLQARLSQLESDLTAAKGEAAILRSKYEKAQATHDAEVARLIRESAEQLAKKERILEEARIAERTTATELQFARQDLREELGRAKSRRKDGQATPKRDRTWGMADGFDGVEILSSPTKGQALRRKDSVPGSVHPSERTPSKGKRKRPIVDSPTFALETDGGDTALDTQSANASSIHPSALAGVLPFDFLRLLLDHTALQDQPPTFEVLSRYSFPSRPGQSLSSVILQKLPQMGRPGDPLSLLVDFADLLIELWHQSLSERYYGPIYYLAALVLYALEFNAVTVAPHIVSTLVPVCVTTCRLVALPRLSADDGELSNHPDTSVRQLCLEIDVTQCLSLLYLAALGCLPLPYELEPGAATVPPKPSPQREFWGMMELDFVLLMLSPKQPEADWLAMMSLLRTSVTAASFGPVPPSATGIPGGRAEKRSPVAVAATVIDCVSSFLCEPPRWALPGSTRETVARLAALETLTTFAMSPFGALQIAGSDVAIPRLVTVLCWAIDRLYDSDVTLKAGIAKPSDAASLTQKGDQMDVDQQTQEAAHGAPADEAGGGSADSAGPEPEQDLDPGPDPMPVLYRLISRTTWLLHFLVTSPGTAEVANTSTKLAAAHGGSQRYFLALARLNFAEEDLVLEAGIDAETVELAHDLLELAVTPDEGEEISELFD